MIKEIDQELTRIADKYLKQKMALHNKYGNKGTYVDLHGLFAYEALIVVDL